MSTKIETDNHGKKSEAQILKWYGPVLHALQSLGGSATTKEVLKKIKESLNFSDEELSKTYEISDQRKFNKQFYWMKEDFSTFTGSVLHCVLPQLQPAQM
jgi:hypothetical protein